MNTASVNKIKFTTHWCRLARRSRHTTFKMRMDPARTKYNLTSEKYQYALGYLGAIVLGGRYGPYGLCWKANESPPKLRIDTFSAETRSRSALRTPGSKEIACSTSMRRVLRRITNVPTTKIKTRTTIPTRAKTTPSAALFWRKEPA